MGGWVVFCNWKYSKCQDLAKFQFGGGYSVIENTQSPKIWLNFNFQGGGVFCNQKYSKSQDMAKFQFWGGVFCNWKYSKSQDLAKFQFSGEGGYSVIENTQSPKIWLNFNFQGGGVFCNQKYSKSQDMAKFQFLGGVFCNWKYSKSQDLAKFQFSGEGGYSVTENTQSPKIWLNFSLGGGGIL